MQNEPKKEPQESSYDFDEYLRSLRRALIDKNKLASKPKR